MKNNRLEELYMVQTEYYSKLAVLTYDDIIKILMENDNYSISFFDGCDTLNDIRYQLVDVVDCNGSSVIYKAENNDLKEIYSNLIAAFKSNGLEVEYKFEQLFSGYDVLGCVIGTNYLQFPIEVVNYLRMCKINIENIEYGDICCYDYDNYYGFPGSLSYDIIQKRRKKTDK